MEQGDSPRKLIAKILVDYLESPQLTVESPESTPVPGSSENEKEEYQEKDFTECEDAEWLSERSIKAAEPTPTKPEKPRKLHQWFIVGAGFFANFVVSGLGNTYSLYQLYHKENAGRPTSMLPAAEARNTALIALIGSLGGSSLNYFGTIFIAPFLSQAVVPKSTRSWPCLSNAAYITVGGAFLILLGQILASFSTKYWHLVLSHGILPGLGGALVLNPINTIAPEYFVKHRGKTTGLMSAGAAVGGMALPAIVQVINDRAGIRWSLRTMGILPFFIAISVAAFCPPPRPCTGGRKFMPKGVRKDIVFWLVIIAEIAASITALIPTAFAPEVSKALGFTTKEAAMHILMLNGVGIAGRCGMGWLRDKIGSQNALIFVSVLLALANFLWLGSIVRHGKESWLAFLVFWGLGTSGFHMIVNSYVLDVFGSEGFFGIMGIINLARGAGSVAGAPLAGTILGKRGDFMRLFVFVEVLLWVTAGASIAAKYLLKVRNSVLSRE